MRIALLAAALLATSLVASASAQSPVLPAAGDLAISEIMFNPTPDTCVTDNNGEYFEITNISCKVLDLNAIFVQDGVAPGATFFQVLASVAALPPLYPGQRFLFCRKNDPLLNAGLANVDYWFAADATAPADNSQVGSTSMNFNNGSSGDGIHISVGGPLVVPFPNPNNYTQGSLIESVTYLATSAPFTSSGAGQAAERKDLFAPVAFSGTINSANLAVSTQINNSCVGNTYFGTPRLRNSVDVSSWPKNVLYDSIAFPNSGTLNPLGPVSVGAASIEFAVGNGPAGAAIFLAYADAVTPFPELALSLLLPGNPGSFVIDIFTAGFIEGSSFDGAGGGIINVGIPNDPMLIAKKFQLQWAALNPSFVLIMSNGAQVEVAP